MMDKAWVHLIRFITYVHTQLLWHAGVEVYDVVMKSSFTLKAILMWTVNDFPAYGNLAGCTTKGKTACPICGNNTMSQWLSDARKTVYLCNRCFLEANHPFRIKKSWFDGNIEDRERPRPLTGSEIFEEVKHIENEWGKVKNKRKRKGQVILFENQLKMAESSRQAAKRAKRQRQSILAALRNNPNRVVHITNGHSDQHTNSSKNLPTHDTPNLSSQESDKGKSVRESDKGKSVRGPTKCNYLKKGGKVEVGFNKKGQPIGPGSKRLSSYAGAIAREMISILYEDWRKVPDEHKDFIWEVIKGKFVVDHEEGRAYALKMVGKLWRTYKSRLRRQASTCKKENLRKLKPDGSTQVEWDIFLKRRLSKDFTGKSARFKAMREKQDLPYTGSRMGYARLEEKLKNESVDPASITRVDVWCAGHTKTNGEASNEYVANCLDKIDEFNASSSNSNLGSIREDALAHVLGPEHRRPPRGVEFGVTSARLESPNRRNEKMARLEERVETMANNIERMTDIILNQKSLIDALNLKLMEYERHGDLLSSPGYDAYTFTSQAHGGDGDIQTVQPEKCIPHEMETISWKEGGNCKLIDWIKGDEVVAVARWVTSDLNSLLHCKPLGNNSSKVWVVKAKKPLAPLWRTPNSEINNMKEAVGTTIAWPTDHILMEEPDIF